MPNIILVLICGLFALGLGTWVFRRMDVAPYPSATSWLLRIPLPWLTNKRLLGLLCPQPGERLIEIGPGTGLQTTAIAPHVAMGGTLEIVDVQSVMLHHSMKRVHKHKLTNVIAVKASAERLPFKDNTFDGGYLITTLGEIPDPLTALRELRRIIKPSGRLVVGEWVSDKHGVKQSQLRDWAKLSGFHIPHIRGNSLAYLAKLI